MNRNPRVKRFTRMRSADGEKMFKLASLELMGWELTDVTFRFLL